jgi:maleate cis-trans isomerase
MEAHMEKAPMSSSCAKFGRRSFLRRAAGAALSTAGAPLLNLLSAPAKASNWRGLVGCIKPRAKDSSLVDMIRLLPSGIGVLPVYLNLTEGTREGFQNSYANYEKNVAYLASQRCDTISIEGAPPFMLLGSAGEAKLLDGWKQKYKTDMFTSSQNQVNVLRAMKIKKILGITAFGTDLNRSYAKYFEDSGIAVVAMEGMDVSFASIPDVPSETIYAFIKKKFLEHKSADAIYILGSGLGALSLVGVLEQDLGVPAVVQPIAARIWEIQRRLHVHEPIKGFGSLLETLPA